MASGGKRPGIGELRPLVPEQMRDVLDRAISISNQGSHFFQLLRLPLPNDVYQRKEHILIVRELLDCSFHGYLPTKVSGWIEVTIVWGIRIQTGFTRSRWPRTLCRGEAQWSANPVPRKKITTRQASVPGTHLSLGRLA